jgi:uncharacterized protein YbbK (DUF523 family)
VGVSACLLGQAVRHDGGHKLNAFVVEDLAEHVELVPVCPEVEIGLGVPREPIRLESAGGSGGGASGPPRLVTIETRRDLTERMRAYAELRVAALASLGLAGYVTKSKSPSCGLQGVPVHGADTAAPGAAKLPAIPAPLGIPQPGPVTDAGLLPAAGWMGHGAALLALLSFLGPLVRKRAADVATLARRDRLAALDQVVMPVIALILIGQGWWKARPLIDRVWTLTAGDDWFEFESQARDILAHGLMMTQGAIVGRGQPFFY